MKEVYIVVTSNGHILRAYSNREYAYRWVEQCNKSALENVRAVEYYVMVVKLHKRPYTKGKRK